MKTPEQMIADSNFADDVFLTRDELCSLLKISKQTLYGWERKNAGPPKVRIAGCVRYPKKFLDKFLGDRVQLDVNEESKT